MKLDVVRRRVSTLALVALATTIPQVAQAGPTKETMEFIVDRLDKYSDNNDWTWDEEEPCQLQQAVKDANGKVMRTLTFMVGDISQVETGRERINLEMRGAGADVVDSEGTKTKTMVVQIRLQNDEIRPDLEEAFDEARARCVKREN